MSRKNIRRLEQAPPPGHSKMAERVGDPSIPRLNPQLAEARSAARDMIGEAEFIVLYVRDAEGNESIVQHTNPQIVFHIAGFIGAVLMDLQVAALRAMQTKTHSEEVPKQ